MLPFKQTQTVQPVTKSVFSGAITQDATYTVDLQENAALVMMKPADSVEIVSPNNATTPADIEFTINGNATRRQRLAGGGNAITIQGPIYSVEITPRLANVAGSDADDVVLTFAGPSRFEASHGNRWAA